LSRQIGRTGRSGRTDNTFQGQSRHVDVRLSQKRTECAYRGQRTGTSTEWQVLLYPSWRWLGRRRQIVQVAQENIPQSLVSMVICASASKSRYCHSAKVVQTQPNIQQYGRTVSGRRQRMAHTICKRHFKTQTLRLFHIWPS